MSELILVVDDEESLCELMAEILANEYQVLKAYDGKEALEMARQHKPDLILSDVMMPHMSGVELLKAIRADPELKDTPVVLLSAAPSQYIAREAEAFVKKPFELDVLENVVAEITGIKKSNVPPNQSFIKHGYNIEPARPLPHPSLQPSNAARTFSIKSRTFFDRPDSC
jgi:CheY-like chemotaxis protein